MYREDFRFDSRCAVLDVSTELRAGESIESVYGRPNVLACFPVDILAGNDSVSLADY